jgi:hypothetical protein
MRTRTLLASMVLVLAGAALCLAQDVNMGTWKLNDAKSKFGAGNGKATTVVYEMDGDNVKVTVDGTTADGKPMHNVWVGKYDGRDYPVKGDAAYDSRAYTKVTERTTNMTIKKDGKVIANGTISVAPDGKSRQVKVSGVDPHVTAYDQSAIYNKQ